MGPIVVVIAIAAGRVPQSRSDRQRAS
jgi:hypothetical protein